MAPTKMRAKKTRWAVTPVALATSATARSKVVIGGCRAETLRAG